MASPDSSSSWAKSSKILEAGLLWFRICHRTDGYRGMGQTLGGARNKSLRNSKPGAPGWLCQLSIQLLVLAQVMISTVRESEHHIGLCADSNEPAWDSLSLFLSPFLSALPFSLSLSQNKLITNKRNSKPSIDHIRKGIIQITVGNL